MTIDLYVTDSDKRVLNKNLKNKKTLHGNLKNETSIINPTILIETNYVNSNYCYIKEFSRYYYINNITSIRNNLWMIDCSVDVLMSNKDEIKYLPCLVDKLSDINKIDNFLTTNVDSETGLKTQIIPFANGFEDNPKFVLVTLSGNTETLNVEEDVNEVN